MAEASLGKLKFVVHKHSARRLHYDFRLEIEGVLKSWAVPREPPVEDHPLDYADFEGEIPEGTYGAGKVEIWDSGSYDLIDLKEDKIVAGLHGKKLKGKYVLVRFKGEEKNWLFFKGKD